MTDTTGTLAPVSASERIYSLDVLRGVALLGILIMNIQGFAMIQAAYFNPTAYGDLTGINWWVWLLSHIFGDQKFMTIFSIMFGAGILLMADRAEAKGGSAASIHYRRTFWLLMIGLIHSYLLWHGDILVPYVFCAVIVFLFRKRKPRTLLILGLLSLSVSSVIYTLMGWSLPYWPPEAVEGISRYWEPTAELVEKEIAAFRGSWSDQLSQRVPASFGFQTMVFFMWGGWRAGGLMLVGMALYKWGVLTAERSNGFYLKGVIIGLLVGLALVIFGVTQHVSHGWTMEYSFFLGMQYNYWGSLGVSFAFISIVMLICKSGALKTLSRAFSAVGRTALSNYLLQTLIGITIFYGPGFGLFGHVERYGQILIVIAIWILQLIISPLWLRYFRFGPAEWLWRSLTYWKRQPMRV
ncbi:MAG: DUF418 domain-containing protein [Bacteroidota bacterium]